MNFFRPDQIKAHATRWGRDALRPLVIALVALACLTADASAETSWLERREMTYARRAFQDSLYDVARLKLERFLEKRPESDFAPEARWLLGQSHYFLGHFDRALVIFKDFPKEDEETWRPRYRYWLAETLAALQRYEEAAVLYQEHLESHPESEQAIGARIGWATCLYQTDQPSSAMDVLDPMLAEAPTSLAFQEASLKKAQFLIDSNDPAKALAQLQSLPPDQWDASLEYAHRYWTGFTHFRLGQREKAAEFFQQVTDDKRAHPRRLVVKSWIGLGKAFKAQTEWDKAANAFQEAFTLARNGSLIEEAVLQFLHSRFQEGSLAKGAVEIRKYAATRPEYALPGLLAIGQFYFDDGNYDAAISEMDNLIRQFPDSPTVWPARLLIARSFQAKDEPDAAIEAYRTVILDADIPSLTVAARKELARFLFEQGRYADAAASFQALSEDPACPQPLREGALFSSLKALAAQDAIEPFQDLETHFYQQFPDTRFRADLLMIKARLHQRAGQRETAQTLFAQLAETHPESPQAATALYSLGRSYFENGLYDQAAATLKIIEQKHPEHPQLTDAIYLRILSELNTGQLDHPTARQQLSSLADGSPQSPLLPKIRFKAASTWMDQGRYVEALPAFTAIVDQFPKTAEAEYAAYLAGRAAMRLNDHSAAIAQFEKVPQTSQWKVHAHLAQIRCYMARGEFQSAREIAESIIQKSDPGPVRSEALIRKADCLITQEDPSPESELTAFQAVEEVIQSKASTIAQRNEAGFLKGKILQRQGKSSEAIEAYLDVVYGKLLPADVTQRSLRPEYHFFIESGVTAAQMLKDAGDIRGAVEVYRILERLGAPHRNQFRRAIEDLKTQYFIYEET